jgi:hypothetical protein
MTTSNTNDLHEFDLFEVMAYKSLHDPCDVQLRSVTPGYSFYEVKLFRFDLNTLTWTQVQLKDLSVQR